MDKDYLLFLYIFFKPFLKFCRLRENMIFEIPKAGKTIFQMIGLENTFALKLFLFVEGYFQRKMIIKKQKD